MSNYVPDDLKNPWAYNKLEPECKLTIVFKSGKELETLCAMKPEHFLQIWDKHFHTVRIPVSDQYTIININKRSVDYFKVERYREEN